MRRNYSPCALHHELHQEAAGGEACYRVRPGPQRDHRQREQRGVDDGSFAAEALGGCSAENASEERANVGNRNYETDVSRSQRVVLFEKGWIEILGPVAEGGE